MSVIVAVTDGTRVCMASDSSGTHWFEWTES